jgi:lipoate-protein ligase A
VIESGPHGPLPGRWTWWEDGAHDGVSNMAVDEALLATVRPGEGTWRWYAWSVPTVSFGRNERIAGRLAPAQLAASGLGAVRRPTGGRALLHHRELTYCVTMPLAAHLSWRVAYDAVNRVLRDALRTTGVPVQLAADGGPVSPDGPVCFDRPAAGELTVGGRKLVGSAVWRHGGAYLQHGSILLHDDQHLLQAISPSAAPTPAAATLTECRPDVDEEALGQRVRGAVHDTLQTRAEVQLRHERLDDDWPGLVASHRRHFSDPAWLWRR